MDEPGFSASGPFGSFGPDELLNCYATGVFPMGEARDDPRVFLVEPDQRGVVPLAEFRIPARLRRTVRSESFVIRVDTAFDAVLDACAAPGPGREDSWINGPIRRLYGELNARATPIRSSAGATNASSAASTASPSAGPSSARACSAVNGTPQRSPWSIWLRGSNAAAGVCSTPSS